MTGEQLHQGPTHLLVDEDVEQRVDEIVEIHKHDHLLKNFLFLLQNSHHEDDAIWPNADEEGKGDESCDNSHSSFATQFK